jgi:hypothetical protein
MERTRNHIFLSESQNLEHWLKETDVSLTNSSVSFMAQGEVAKLLLSIC